MKYPFTHTGPNGQATMRVTPWGYEVELRDWQHMPARLQSFTPDHEAEAITATYRFAGFD